MSESDSDKKELIGIDNNMDTNISINDDYNKDKNLKIYDDDDTAMMNFWNDTTIPTPPGFVPYDHKNKIDDTYNNRITGDLIIDHLNVNDNDDIMNNSDLADDTDKNMNISNVNQYSVFTPPPIPTYESDFDKECKSISLIVNKIPIDVIKKEKNDLNLIISQEKVRNALELLNKENDIIWRENLARQRILQIEKNSKKKLNDENILNILEGEKKEKKIGRDFRRARENLEAGVRRQLVSIRERFGDILIAGSSLSRTYGVHSTYAPQPVEIRIHFMRAVKCKLVKGKYVVMLTQYDSLGGNPIAWSKVGTYGMCLHLIVILFDVYRNLCIDVFF